MDRMSFLQRTCNAIRRLASPVLLRKLEFSFYFLFPILAFASFVLPFVLDVKKGTFYLAGVCSLAYAISFFLCRFKIHASYGLVLHTGAFLVLSSLIFFDTNLIAVGATLIVLGSFSFAAFCIFIGLGRDVFVVNGAVEQQANQPRLEMDGQANLGGQADQVNPPHQWNVNGGINPPQMQADGDANPPAQIRINDGVNPQLQVNGAANPPPQMHINGGNNLDMPINDDVVNPPQIQVIEDVNHPQFQVNDNVHEQVAEVAAQAYDRKEKDANGDQNYKSMEEAATQIGEIKKQSDLQTEAAVEHTTVEGKCL